MTRVTPGLILLPATANTHAGHDAGSFAGGFRHPPGGADHLLATVAVGLRAAQAGGRALTPALTRPAGASAGVAGPVLAVAP